VKEHRHFVLQSHITQSGIGIIPFSGMPVNFALGLGKCSPATTLVRQDRDEREGEREYVSSNPMFQDHNCLSTANAHANLQKRAS
jgi:hypothetical protein